MGAVAPKTNKQTNSCNISISILKYLNFPFSPSTLCFLLRVREKSMNKAFDICKR